MIEVILIILGGLVLTAGYLIPAKKEHKSEQQIGEEQVREMVEKEMGGAKEQLSDIVDETITYAMERTERAMERLSNEKIMAIEEYSGTVMTDIGRNHEEVVFLYDMLNDKHENLKTTVSEANKTAAEVKQTLKDAEVTAQEAKETLKSAEETAQEAKQSASASQHVATTAWTPAAQGVQSAPVMGMAGSLAPQGTLSSDVADAERDAQERLAKVREEMQRMEMAATLIPAKAADPIPADPSTADTETVEKTMTVATEDAAPMNAEKSVEEIEFKPLEVSRVKIVSEEEVAEKKTTTKKPSSKSKKKAPAKESEAPAEKLEVSEPKGKQEVQPPVLRTKTDEELALADARAENVEIQFHGNRGGRNNNDRILELHQAGKSNMAIAKELGLGIGEVKLVIDLFKGAKK